MLPIRAYLYLTITTAFWAGNAVMGKFAVGHISPLTLSLLRWGLAFLLIVLISIPQLKADWPEIRKHWLLLLAYGAFGFAGFNAFLYSALNHTTAINCAIEQAGIPGVIFLANYLLFRTRVSVLQCLGFAVTMAGVAITAAHGSLDALLRLEFNLGDGLMMLAILAYSTYTVSLRYKPKIHWKTQMAIPALGALLVCIPLAGWEFASGSMILPDAIGWTTVLYTAIFPSLMSQVLYVQGVDLIGPNRAGLFINAVPIFGTLFSVVFLGEMFQSFHFLAILLVLGGIAIAERGRPKLQ